MYTKEATIEEGRDRGRVVMDSTDDLRFAPQTLLEQLLSGFHGCSLEEHDEPVQTQLQAEDTNHHSLGELFLDTFISTFG